MSARSRPAYKGESPGLSALSKLPGRLAEGCQSGVLTYADDRPDKRRLNCVASREANESCVALDVIHAEDRNARINGEKSQTKQFPVHGELRHWSDASRVSTVVLAVLRCLYPLRTLEISRDALECICPVLVDELSRLASSSARTKVPRRS